MASEKFKNVVCESNFSFGSIESSLKEMLWSVNLAMSEKKKPQVGLGHKTIRRSHNGKERQ